MSRLIRRLGVSMLAALWLLGCGALVTRAAPAQAAPANGSRPNVLLIVTDDLGYGDLGVQPGHKEIETPNIDRLAHEGVRMTQGYAATPICSPSRASLLTGRYPQRFGYGGNWEAQAGVPQDVQMAPRYLNPLGYRTGLIGKWHLGATPEKHPLNRGFDYFFGFLGGNHDYFDPDRGANWWGGPHHVSFTYENWRRVHEMDYNTIEYSQRASRFIERNRDQPFFLSVMYTAAHGPAQMPDRYIEPYLDDPDVPLQRAKRRAVVEAMDDGVGRILQTLERQGVADETIVMFLSDNGGLHAGGGADNWILRGHKGMYTEGGLRIPWLVRWPDGLPAGETFEHPVHHIDVLATILGAADAPVPDVLDGKNLMPYWRGDKTGAPHEYLHWRLGPQYVVRHGPWKLVKDGRIHGLYNLQEDPREQNDLRQQRPELARELRRRAEAWNAKNPDAPYITRENRVVNRWELRFRRNTRRASRWRVGSGIHRPEE